jgi:glycosyltransferase involved in cell wall biosynthesis
MKIVFYNHTGKVSGAERLLLSVLSRLSAGEFIPLVLCPDDGPLAEMVAANGTPVETIARLEARFTWRPDQLLHYCKSFYQVIVDFRRRVVKLDPDLIHANSIRAGLVATAATLGLKIKVVWHLHDLLPPHPLSVAIRALAALSGRSRMIAVSEAVSRNFCGCWAWLLKRRVTVILNAIDPASFAARSIDREECRARLSLSNDDFAIGIVGQLTPRKGQLELVRAFAKLLAQVPQAVLLVTGAAIFNRDSEYDQLLRETVEELGIAPRVHMLGSRQDVPEIITALDLLVINSRREPFGLVACEAMACGTPVVATARDGLSEIIQHQRSGWLVPYGDEAELIGAITFLNQRPDARRELANTAQQHVARRFTIQRYMKELQAFYRTIHSESFPASSQNQEKSFHPEVI